MMTGKCKTTNSPAGSAPKKQRKAIDLDMKMIKEYEGGKGVQAIANTAKGLASAFAKINEALLEIEAMEPNVERFTKVERNMNEALRCYREIYDEKKRQTTQKSILSFFSKRISPSQTPSKSSATPTPSASPSSTPDFPIPGPSRERNEELDDSGPSTERDEDADDPEVRSNSRKRDI